MDRIKCPFHGKIIGRSSNDGSATNPNEETAKPKTSKTTNEDLYQPLGDDDFLRDLSAATGKDLTIKKRQKNKHKKKKMGNLTKLRNDDDSPRKRLERLVCSSKSLNKVGSIMDNIETKQHQGRFHHSFNYAISPF
jgi:hypothetical protein